MLTRISKSGTIIRDSDLPDNWKYLKLYEYFGLQSASKITLTFSEIESILGFPLTESIKTSRPAWYSRKDGHMMADAWNLQGYKLAHLYPGKKKAVFESVYEDAEKVVIPAEILDRKVPVRAKREIEHFLAAIVKKYGLSTEDYFPSKSGDSP